MILPHRKYDLKKDLEVLRRKLEEIRGLREYIMDPRWRIVRNAFNEVIDTLTQDVLDKCDNPRRYETEIRCKRLVAEGFGAFLAFLENEIGDIESLRQEIMQKEKATKKSRSNDQLI